MSSFTSTPSLPSLPQPLKPKSSLPFSSSVSIDPDYILPEDLRVKFRQLLQTCDRIIDPDMIGYNGCWSQSSVREHWPCTAPSTKRPRAVLLSEPIRRAPNSVWWTWTSPGLPSSRESRHNRWVPQPFVLSQKAPRWPQTRNSFRRRRTIQ